MDSVHSVFLLFAAALVMIMVPGVGLFYGGMVRSKNVVSTIIESFVILAVVDVVWVVVGYTLTFGPDVYHMIGNFDFAFLRNLPPLSPFSEKIDITSFVLFQGMFAAIAPVLINGSVVERVRFPALLMFSVLWSLAVYCPVAHWVWGPKGFLADMGALDFAGGTVIHVTSGFSGLAACLFVGKRDEHGLKAIPHNITLSVIGAIFLWFGWFGFNGGSALYTEKLFSTAFLTTHTAAGCGLLGWMAVEWLHRGKPTALGVISGMVAGLVGITPGAGFVSVTSSILIGFITGIVCYGCVIAKHRFFHYDDALDAFGIHGVGGFIGSLLTGVFASKLIDPAIPDGLLLAGNVSLVGVQLLAVLIAAVYSFLVTLLLLKAIHLFTPIRTRGNEEEMGLDITQHGESGYRF